MSSATTPFIRLLVPFVMGIALAECTDWQWPFLTHTMIFLGLLLFVLAHWKHPIRWRWASAAVAYLLLLTIGFGHTRWYDERTDQSHFERVVSDSLPPAAYIGIVYDAPGKGGRRAKVPVRIEALKTREGTVLPVRGHVLCFVEPPDSADVPYHYGDRVAISGKVAPTQTALNPHSFDYQRYLHFQNIHYQCFVKTEDIEVLSSGHGSWFWRVAFSCRTHLLELLRQHFNSQQEYSVAAALLVGYTDELSEDLRTAYAETGSMPNYWTFLKRGGKSPIFVFSDDIRIYALPALAQI
jgi:competence protein ComEC